MDAAEGENQISVWQKNNNCVFGCSFVPYDCNFEDRIYIEGDGCVLNVTNIDGMEIFYDEIDNEFQVHLKDMDIYISKL